MLLILGGILALRGSLLELSGLRVALKGDSSKNLAWIRGFRLSIFGLAIAGVGASWLWHLDWLLVLSLVIGGEEILESSMVIYELRLGEKMNAKTGASVWTLH